MADITRAEVASLIGEEYGPEVIKGATAGSTALAAFPTINMGTKTTHMPVLTTLPTAAWVGDVLNTEVKPTSQVVWADKTLVAEEIAVIIPIHENTIDDANADVLSEIAEVGGQAIGKVLDQAILHGTNKPASWTSLDLVAAAVAASQTQAIVDGAGNVDDAFGAILKAAGLVAGAGFNPTTLLSKVGLRYQLANLRGTDGHPVLMGSDVAGFQTHWNQNGAWEAAEATAIVVDPSCVRIGVRQDVTVKLLTEATITGLGNLAELDMVALRFKARFAYVLGTPATSEGNSKTPVAVVTPDVTP